MRHLTGKEIVVASHNKGKVAEINELLAPYGFHARSAAEMDLAEPEENGETFEENAFAKALAASAATGLAALSDDSGLCVDALGGEPGIHTADWAERPDGAGRDFVMAMQKVENALTDKSATTPQQRTGRFVCVLCLCWPDGHAEYFRGEVAGQLVWPPRGDKGFGYDPIFLPDGYEQTFGEMEADQKHSWQAGSGELGLSHRARAFAKFAKMCLEPGRQAGAK